jgi:hypothetical protein
VGAGSSRNRRKRARERDAAAVPILHPLVELLVLRHCDRQATPARSVSDARTQVIHTSFGLISIDGRSLAVVENGSH